MAIGNVPLWRLPRGGRSDRSGVVGGERGRQAGPVPGAGESASIRFELWVRNPGVTPGYHNLPDVNADRIRDGWLATGDLFHCDEDGFYHFRGRTDDMFNSGGENIYPKEVEDLLLSHPDVLDAAVLPVPHALKGAVPAAMVKLASGSALTVGALKRYTLEEGPAYAHPRHIVVVDEMPLTGVGKVDRAEMLTVLLRMARDR